MDQITHQIKKAHNILLTSHSDPDGDAVSSVLALGLALSRLDKKVTLYNSSPIPAVYRFLPSVERIVSHIKKAATYDVALILDCGSLSRVGQTSSTISQIPVVINIDHHISNTGFGDIQLIDANASSTAELVYRLIKALNVPMDKDIATSIYTGILTDTGSFRFSNTNQAAFAISHEMTELGVEPYRVAQHVFGTYSLERIKLLNLALDSLEISENGKLSVMTVTNAMFDFTETHPEDVDGMINYARRIQDVKVAALIQEQRNGKSKSDSRRHFHVSLRSDGSVDVAAIAGAFGGGGHASAAGFQAETSLLKLKSDIITLAQNL
jgi:bifunctional oligoribonuclease and PAP phosphatase NrnA